MSSKIEYHLVVHGNERDVGVPQPQWAEMHPLLCQRPPTDAQEHVGGRWCSQVIQFIHPHYFAGYYFRGLSLLSTHPVVLWDLAAYRFSNQETQYVCAFIRNKNKVLFKLQKLQINKIEIGDFR